MDIINHEKYIRRCITLAKLAAGSVAPNPLVGSVLVYKNRIIGEGYHEMYGQAHAEVNCIQSVKTADENLMPLSTLYVSLEPCNHYGKTPPCTDLIIQKKIPSVVIGCQDPFPQVSGSGIAKLRAAGIHVETDILEPECRELIKRFYTNITQKRPYVILKWAQTSNGMIAHKNFSRILISNNMTNRLVHKWRSEEASVMVGTNTALFDDPLLTNRFWTGRDPVRLVLDLDLKLPLSLHLFDQSVKTIVFNKRRHEEHRNLIYYKVDSVKNIIKEITDACFQLKIESILVEGGTRLLQAFINEGYWDEARVITNDKLIIPDGLKAPELRNEKLNKEEIILSDRVRYYHNSLNF